MAVRRPLYNNAGNIQEMSDAQITQLKQFCGLKYWTGSNVELSVQAGIGNIGTISDTRLQAGAASTSSSSFPSESTTAEPSVVTVNYNNIFQDITAGSGSGTYANLTPDNGKLYPVYFDSQNNIQAMNLQDMKDTLIHPTFDDFLFSTSNGQNQAGTYYISTSSTASFPYQVVSTTPIFSDTRADTSLYTAGGIGETLDQPTTIQNYYLHANITTPEAKTLPLYLRSDNDLQEYPESDFGDMIDNLMGYTALNSPDGYTLRYTLGTTGGTGTFTKGTGMADTRLNGSGNYQTRFVGADDYRAQEFPDGTPTTINTYYLRIVKA